MNRAADYLKQVDQWVLARSKTANGFDELVRGLYGVFPSDIAASVRRLATIDENLKTLLPPDEISIQPRSRTLDDSGWLPVPHPLDFDWRFHGTTIHDLLGIVSTERPDCRRFCSLGAPTIVPALQKRIPCCQPLVIDANPLVGASLKEHCPSVTSFTIDLTRGLLPQLDGMDVILADPPWYEAQMRAFVWAASQLCSEGTTILVSFPAVGTRANIDSQRDELISFALTQGLHLAAHNVGQLRYTSPYFEQNAMSAFGIERVPIDWRIADLLIFKCRERISAPPPVVDTVADWIEFQIDGVRVKAKSKACRGGDPRLHSIVDGDILDTVSQRDPRVASIDVWTMGNRVFSCENTELLLSIASALAVGNPAQVAFLCGKSRSTSEVIGQLQAVADAESHHA